jgi:mannose-6-phosphate isomerase-like protein (cupin superfamily)
MEKVNLQDKFALFNQHWTPKIVGEYNDSYVLLAKFKGELFWHKHEDEDEFFMVIKGKLLLKLRDRDIWLQEGELFIIPKGVEHMPVAEEEVHMLVLDLKSARHTGNVVNERTLTSYERI